MSAKEKIIDAQISVLLLKAPDQIMAKTLLDLAPILKAIAVQQKYLNYFVLRSPNYQPLITTIKHRHKPNVSKDVIYAYPSKAIAQTECLREELICEEIAIILLLVQVVGMNEVDSLILVGDRPETKGTEINRRELYNSCQQALNQAQGGSIYIA